MGERPGVAVASAPPGGPNRDGDGALREPQGPRAPEHPRRPTKQGCSLGITPVLRGSRRLRGTHTHVKPALPSRSQELHTSENQEFSEAGRDSHRHPRARAAGLTFELPPLFALFRFQPGKDCEIPGREMGGKDRREGRGSGGQGESRRRAGRGERGGQRKRRRGAPCSASSPQSRLGLPRPPCPPLTLARQPPAKAGP